MNNLGQTLFYSYDKPHDNTAPSKVTHGNKPAVSQYNKYNLDNSFCLLLHQSIVLYRISEKIKPNAYVKKGNSSHRSTHQPHVSLRLYTEALNFKLGMLFKEDILLAFCIGT